MNRPLGVLAIAFVAAMPGCEKEKSVAVPGLFSYAIQDWNAAAQRNDWKGSWPEIRRNSDGSRLYCHHWDDGTVRVISGESRSDVLRPPARLSYLNDSGQVVAWGDSVRVGFRLLNGVFVSTAWPDGGHGYFGVDPSGRFFFVAQGPRRTMVASIDAPGTALFESPFQGRWLFARGERLYLFGQIFEDTSHEEVILGDIFEFMGGNWRRVRSLTIPRKGGRGPSPYYVADMDPAAERILAVDTRDLRPDRYYLHDVNTGSSTRVTLPQGQRVLFLKEDLLRGVRSAAPATDARR